MKVFVCTTDQATDAHFNAFLGDHSRANPEPLPNVAIVDTDEFDLDSIKYNSSFEIFDDVQFQPFHDWWNRVSPTSGSNAWAGKTQLDVMTHIRADKAWKQATGNGVTIAIVDSGVDGTMSGFPMRSTHSCAPTLGDPWQDPIGHGTMCASIACSNANAGGKYNGVAPDAGLLSARTNFSSSDIYLIYEHLIKQKRAGAFPGGLVVSNSYGIYTCDPPSFNPRHPYLAIVRLAVSEGIVCVFAAGNNHAFGLCNYAAQADRPNTIWAVNSIDEVITVGTVDWANTNQSAGEHSNSSRGPGQWSASKTKPDVVAPTYGEVAWLNGYRTMEWWGTSGACPQVAGLAALLLEQDPNQSPAQILQRIRQGAQTLQGPQNCYGAGLIDCDAAVRAQVTP